jgi:hypothetical protein
VSQSAAFERYRDLGRTKYRTNLLAAILTGILPALILAILWPPRLEFLLIGFLGGLFYSNVFEWCYHRFVLHWANGGMSKRHLVHHQTWGRVDEMAHVSFGCGPHFVVLLLAGNILPCLLLDWRFRWGISAPALVAFAAYFCALEAIHWRIHDCSLSLGPWLQAARAHHFRHHAGKEGNYNVFLPIIDYFGYRVMLAAIAVLSLLGVLRLLLSYVATGHL